MKAEFKIAIVAGVLALGLCGVAVSGPLEDGQAAILHGDYLSAMRLLGPLARSGNSAAQYELGRMYDGGQGVAQDHARAAELYRKAAVQGDARAQLSLALMYARGQGVPQDDTQGLYWLGKWGEREDSDKRAKVRMLYYYIRGDALGLAYYQKLAEEGNPNIQLILGGMYYRGDHTARNFSQARFWLLKAAQQGLSEAQKDVGMMYERGQGGEQDFVRAFGWLQKAAEQGDFAAQTNLADLYAKGEGVARDEERAAFWRRKAADHPAPPPLYIAPVRPPVRPPAVTAPPPG